jgi:hypothetical protein
MKAILEELSNAVTDHIMRRYGTVQDMCNLGQRLLYEQALEKGIVLEKQSGLWDERIEHNWCYEPISGTIWDPTGAQFVGGYNGLQYSDTIPRYFVMTPEEIDICNQMASIKRWSNEGFATKVAYGYAIVKEQEAKLQRFRDIYPDLSHTVKAKPSEVKIAKNGDLYGIIRRDVEFNMNIFRISTWKHGTVVTDEQVRSIVVFRNKDGYTLQFIEQRLYVSKNGKTGLITKRGEKIRFKVSKKGKVFYRKKLVNHDNKFVTYEADMMYVYYIEEFKKLIGE